MPSDARLTAAVDRRVDRRALLTATAATAALAAPAPAIAQAPKRPSNDTHREMSQRVWDSPVAPAVLTDFWTQAYQAIDA